MKIIILGTYTLLTTTIVALPVGAENLQHIQQLLSTKECQQCDLSGAGLAMANLSGAKLAGANLSRANLSRTNLSGADLSGTNLSGASLHGANLTGANLTGTNIMGADLRNSYLMNANLTGVDLNQTYLQGAIGIPTYAGTAEDFYKWAFQEAQKGNYVGAIEHYNQVLSINPNFSAAYLARGMARYRLRDETGATQDAQKAAELFSLEGNTQGVEASQNFIKGMEVARQPSQPKEGGSNFLSILGAIGSLLLRFIF